jgi:hypothetical protein
MRHPMRFRSSVGFPTQRNEYSLRAHQEYRSGRDAENDPRSGWPQLLREPPMAPRARRSRLPHITGRNGGEAPYRTRAQPV